jgi:hypothetical protein
MFSNLKTPACAVGGTMYVLRCARARLGSNLSVPVCVCACMCACAPRLCGHPCVGECNVCERPAQLHAPLQFTSFCTAVGCPETDVWDVSDGDPDADAWPSAMMVALKVPPFAALVAQKFMDKNPSIPTGSSVGALASLSAKASTWLHSQKKVWKGLVRQSICFSTHANALAHFRFHPRRLAYVVRFNEFPRCRSKRAGRASR